MLISSSSSASFDHSDLLASPPPYYLNPNVIVKNDFLNSSTTDTNNNIINKKKRRSTPTPTPILTQPTSTSLAAPVPSKNLKYSTPYNTDNSIHTRDSLNNSNNNNNSTFLINHTNFSNNHHHLHNTSGSIMSENDADLSIEDFSGTFVQHHQPFSQINTNKLNAFNATSVSNNANTTNNSITSNSLGKQSGQANRQNFLNVTGDDLVDKSYSSNGIGMKPASSAGRLG